MGGSNRGEPEGGHAGRREKARVIMCEEDVPGYGGMEAADTKETADSWRGCEHGGATWFLYLYYCGLWICLYLYYLRLCGSTAWICIDACRCSRGIDL